MAWRIRSTRRGAKRAPRATARSSSGTWNWTLCSSSTTAPRRSMTLLVGRAPRDHRRGARAVEWTRCYSGSRCPCSRIVLRIAARWPGGHPVLRQTVDDIAEKAGAQAVAVSFYDWETATAWSLRGERWFHAASTIKVPVLLAVVRGHRARPLRVGVAGPRAQPLPQPRRRRALPRRRASATPTRDVHAAIGRMLMRVHELAEHMIVDQQQPRHQPAARPRRRARDARGSLARLRPGRHRAACAAWRTRRPGRPASTTA